MIPEVRLGQLCQPTVATGIVWPGFDFWFTLAACFLCNQGDWARLDWTGLGEA